jgi:hypothetical protein
MEEDLPWKTTSNGRQPPMEDDLPWKTTCHGRRPPMEDNLKILKVEYLSNLLKDHTQIVQLGPSPSPNPKPKTGFGPKLTLPSWG